jgi:hypothetical protein
VDRRYFAYGSNLKWERLRARVPTAAPEGVAALPSHRLVCNKRGRDGSAKANLVVDATSEVWGVVYRLTLDGLALLDRHEGGYRRVEVELVTASGSALRAETYLSDRLTDDPVPFDWYRALILEGAREHDLPAHHLARIEALPWRRDPRRDR